ncbi:hypothetical protein [Actinoplanes sp. L3-i22]|uniref:hypothetical protein n=1 Tax=Actinoplanes sp. L3-i22 TaxID=2836373 RepID=UPI001C7483C4|nr:hypothetical protein [Actinoplanes sp. L3-i22]BCY10495.1 hypothetical protein L3i22_055830 [Actinoplanes sp. L3-i22]
MGTDMDGRVQVRPGGPGTPWADADLDVGGIPRSYEAFGLLFGVRNVAGFVPVAPARGIPGDAGADVLAAAHRFDDHYEHSWVTWAELDRIDWDRPAPVVNAWLSRYRVTAGRLVRVGKGGWTPPDADPAEGAEWRDGDVVWRAERAVPREILDDLPELRHRLDGMRALAGKHGGDNVRMIVWFYG